MSLMNGLSALGAGVEKYAGSAGLEAQRSALEMQKITLADQLAGVRQDKQNVFTSGENVLQRTSDTERTNITAKASMYGADASAGATITSAKISAAAGAELRAAQAREVNAKAELSLADLGKVNTVTGLQQKLADQYANPNPDAAAIKSIGDQITAQGMNAATRSGILTSLDSLSKTEGVNVSLLTRQLSEETDKLGGLLLDPAQQAKQQRIVDDLQTNLVASRARQESFMNQARTVLPGGPAQPSSSPVSGLINSAAPQTSLAAAMPVPSDSSGGAPSAVGAAPIADDRVSLPGDMGNVTNLDALKKLRPELNIDALKGRSPAVIGMVTQLIEGRGTLPPIGSRNPDALLLRGLASQVDPTLDEASSKGRMATRVAFLSGQEARNLTALNTALGHAGEAAEKFAALNNNSFPVLNWAINGAETSWGDNRQKNAEQVVGALASEARKVFAGTGGGSLTELDDWKKNFPIDGSRSQQSGALQTFVHLLNSRLDALGDQYNRGMGVTRDPMTFLEPKARKTIETLTGNAPDPVVGYQLVNPSQSQAGTSAPIPEPPRGFRILK